MSLLNRLFKTSHEPRENAPSAPPPAPDPSAIAAEVAKLEAEERAAKGLAPVDPGTKVQVLAGGNVVVSGPAVEKSYDAPKLAAVQTTPGDVIERGLVRAVGVVPPDAPMSLPPTSAEPIPPETLMTMHPAIQEAAKDFVADPNAAPSAKKRGRPPKVKPASTPPTIATRDAIGAALDQAVAEAEVAAPRETASSTGDAVVQVTDVKNTPVKAFEVTVAVKVAVKPITIFVDNVLDGIDATPLEPYIVEKCDALATEYKAIDIRCAPENSPLAYSKWKGALAGLVRAFPPEPGVYYLNDVRESEIRQCVLEALRPVAAVARGR